MRIILAIMSVVFLMVVTLTACETSSYPDIVKMVKSSKKKH
jgi:hypothetical protein